MSISQVGKLQISAGKSLKKRAVNTPDPNLESSSDSSESEQGSIHGPEYWDQLSKSSSEFSPSGESDYEDDTPPSSPHRQNIINDYLNEVEDLGEESSVDFDDNGSYVFSIDDGVMPDLYDSSDESEEGEGSLPDQQDNEDDLWTEKDLFGWFLLSNRFLCQYSCQHFHVKFWENLT